MANKWPEVRVIDLQRRGALLVEDGNHGEYRPRREEFVTEGVCFIRAADMDAGRVLFESASQINEVARQRIRKGVGRGGDILLSHKGTVGKVATVSVDAPPFVCSPQTTFWRVLDSATIDPRYLHAYLRSHQFHVQLRSRQDETDMAAYVSLTAQRELVVALPPIEIQQHIGSILGSLNDKIELNRRMNRTLEKMAAAIFKSWFIDFDPTRAKAEGRNPNLPIEIADLFPDTFEDSDLGPIPKGWTSGKLADVADNPRRTVKPSDVPPTTPYIGLQHMPRRCIALDAWGRADEVGSGKTHFNEGEILFGKLRPYFHKVGIAPADGVCSTDILVVVPKSAEWHSYVLSLVSSKAFVDYTDSHSAGTKMPRTNWKDMGRYPLALPPEPLARALQDHVAAVHRRIGLAVRQNRRLTGLRDTLLPKLLSGEIELPVAKAIPEEVEI